jgi:hypothetical protein
VTIGVATACQPSTWSSSRPRGLGAYLAQQLVGRRPAGEDLGLALRAHEHDAGVEEARQAVDHRALGVGRAQGVDEVALQSGEAAEDVLLAARHGAVDEVDDLAERRLVRHREDGEAALARHVDQRRRDALEAQADAEAAPPASSCGTSAR